MKRKDKISKFFAESHGYIECVAEYELNGVFIENLISEGRMEDLELFIPIKIQKYADSLNHLGNFNKALTAVDQALASMKPLKGHWKYYKEYSDFASFLKGVCYGRLKKYDESNRIFRSLLKNNPDNDIYLSWYRGNQKAQIDRISNIIIVSCVAIYLVIVIFELIGYDDINPIFRTTFLLIWLFAFAASFLLKQWVEKRTINWN